MREAIFITPPKVGDIVTVEGVQFKAEKREPYVRKRDGADSALMEWSFRCRDCGNASRIKTSCTYATFYSRCLECHRKWQEKRNAERTAKRATAREIKTLPSLETIVAGVHKIGRVQASMAWNAPRRIHAPTLLMMGHDPLLRHTPKEIEASLRVAIARGLVYNAVVAYRPCRHPITGFALTKDGLALLEKSKKAEATAERAGAEEDIFA